MAHSEKNYIEKIYRIYHEKIAVYRRLNDEIKMYGINETEICLQIENRCFMEQIVINFARFFLSEQQLQLQLQSRSNFILV